MAESGSLSDWVLDQYRHLIESRHPTRVNVWPVLSGHNEIVGTLGDHVVLMFVHTGNTAMKTASGVGVIDPVVAGASAILNETRDLVRENLTRHFRLGPSDAVIFVHKEPVEGDKANFRLTMDELPLLLLRHEFFMGLAPNQVFLSHKGMDKPLVRDFYEILKLLGFDPWLDEDAMTAGANRERALLDGFNRSCAAVFFITPNFEDENYLATEIEYAIDQKRNKGDRFAIITLSFDEDGSRGTVPQLLKSRYIYKEPSTRLEALREIIRALPVRVGPVGWRN